MCQSPQYNQSRQIQSIASTGNVYQETDQELGIFGRDVPYLDNPSEEVIFESNQIKQYETMDIPNNEAMLKNT